MYCLLGPIHCSWCLVYGVQKEFFRHTLFACFPYDYFKILKLKIKKKVLKFLFTERLSDHKHSINQELLENLPD